MNLGKTVHDLIFSAIRTLVPAGVTLVLGWVTDNWGFVVGDSHKQMLVQLAYGIAFGLYYLIARLLETYVAPHFGWLLGDFRKGLTAPVYPEPTTTVTVPPATTPNV